MNVVYFCEQIFNALTSVILPKREHSFYCLLIRTFKYLLVCVLALMGGTADDIVNILQGSSEQRSCKHLKLLSGRYDAERPGGGHREVPQRCRSSARHDLCW